MAVSKLDGLQLQSANGDCNMKCNTDSDDERKLREQFDSAVNLVRSLPKSGPFQPSVDMQLRFYSLFKQAMEGKCRAAKPSFWDVVAKKKWEAWSSLQDMPPREAMQQYAQELRRLIENAPQSDERDRLLNKLNETCDSGNTQNGGRTSPQLTHFVNGKTSKGSDHEDDAVQSGVSPATSAYNQPVSSDTEYEDACSQSEETTPGSETSQHAKKAHGREQADPRGRQARLASNKHNQLRCEVTQNRASDAEENDRRLQLPSRSLRRNVAELLRMLVRVQQDLAQLCSRFAAIDTRPPRCAACGAPSREKPVGVSWRSAAAVALWPVLVQLLFYLLHRWWRRVRALRLNSASD